MSQIIYLFSNELNQTKKKRLHLSISQCHGYVWQTTKNPVFLNNSRNILEQTRTNVELTSKFHQNPKFHWGQLNGALYRFFCPVLTFVMWHLSHSMFRLSTYTGGHKIKCYVWNSSVLAYRDKRSPDSHTWCPGF